MWEVLLAAPWVAAIITARSPINDNSFLWHIRAGSIQLEEGSVLTADPFSAGFRGSPWRTQSWLADIAYGALEKVFDLGFVPWMGGVAATVTLIGVLLVVYRASRSTAATAVIAALAAALSVGFTNPRPVLFSYTLFSLVILADQSRRLRWTLPMLIWIWAAVHGSFVVGGAYLLLQAARRRRRRFAREIPIYLAVTLSTAHGWGVAEFLLSFLRSGSALARITEWATPDLLSVSLSPFLVLIVIILSAGIVHQRLRAPDLIVIIPFLLFGLSASRAVFPAFLALAPIAGRALEGWEPRLGRAPLRGGAVVLAVILAVPFLIPSQPGLKDGRFPVRLADRVSGDSVFHDDVVGGYLIYARWPDVHVLIDDRAELYGDYLVGFADARAGRPSWMDFVEASGVQQAIVTEVDPIRQLLLISGWTDVGSEGKFVLMRRSD